MPDDGILKEIDFLPNHNLHDNPIKSQTCRAIVCCPHPNPPPQGRGLIDYKNSNDFMIIHMRYDSSY